MERSLFNKLWFPVCVQITVVHWHILEREDYRSTSIQVDVPVFQNLPLSSHLVNLNKVQDVKLLSATCQ